MPGEPESFKMTECNLLKRSITNAGFGYSFNNVDYWMMYKKTTFTEIFADKMTPKGYKKRGQALDWKSQLQESGQFSNIYKLGSILTPETSGPSNTLVLVLESPKIYDHFKRSSLRDDNIMYKSTGRAFKVS